MIKTVERRIVKGAEGVARFVLEHIEEIIGGATVNFAADCPQEPEAVTGDIDEYRNNSDGWYGIEECASQKHFDHDSDATVLYLDYYGDFVVPALVVYDPDYPSRCIDELVNELVCLAWQMGDRLPNESCFYAEVVDFEAV